MSFKVQWSLTANPVSLDDLSRMTGAGPEYIKQMYRTGSLGPAPDVRVQVATIPLYQVASLFVLLDSSRKQVLQDQIWEALPVLAGAALIRLQLAEMEAGRCVQLGGTADLNRQLWAMLRSAEGKDLLEEKLPGGPVQTRRYAWFNSTAFHTGDDLSEVDGPLDSWKIIDAWEIASRMKDQMRGTILKTTIA